MTIQQSVLQNIKNCGGYGQKKTSKNFKMAKTEIFKVFFGYNSADFP